MMSNIDPMTIVFALVALFVVWRLRSVLGTRTGAERPPMTPRPPGGQVIDLPRAAPAGQAGDRWKGVAAPGSAVARGLDAIAARDSSFDAQPFLAGARGAYEMIISAFAKGDVETLRDLLAPEPLANFTRAIEARVAAGRKMAITLVSLDRADIVEAAAQSGAAVISVKFAAKLNSVTTDGSGAVVDGAPTEITEPVEVWTFSRPFAARDPNWLLTATEATP